MGSNTMARNFDGNMEDARGGSFYVVDADGERVAGPFGVGAYCIKVKERMQDKWPTELTVEYEQ